MADEKFSITNVRSKMTKIENYFADFSKTLLDINSYIETNVNASVESAVFGDLGGKLINIWNHNSSTFQDFHDNFDNWAQVVAIIAANNSAFAVDAAATYRDSIGTLDGVKEARDFVSKNNGLEKIYELEGFGTISNDARSILDSSFKLKTQTVTNKNEYDGKTISYTDAAGNKIELFYDKDNNLVGQKTTDLSGNVKYKNDKGEKVDNLPTGEEYKEAKKKEQEELEAAAKAEEEAKAKAEEEAKGTTIELPEGLGSVHSYMGWQCITSKTSDQYKLREQAGMNFDSEGFGKIGDRYVVATTTTFGNVGDYIDVKQADGTILKCIIGDIKNQNDAGCTKWGHNNGKCVVEFVVDKDTWYSGGKGSHENPGTSSCHPEWNQNILSITNVGSYFDDSK